MSALFRWPCSISIHLSPRSVTAGVLSAGHVACLFICLPGLSLVVSALFRWPCSVSIHLSPRSVTASPPFSARPCSISIHLSPSLSLLVSARSISMHLSPRSVAAGVGPFPLAMQHFYSFVSPPVSALFRWPCSVSIHLSPRSVTGGAALFRWRCNISIHSPNSFPLRRVSQFFLKMCPPFLSLLVSTHFRWPCSISIRVFPMWFVYFCFPVRCLHCWHPPFSPFQHFIDLSPR